MLYLCRNICINVCNNVYMVITFSRQGINGVNGCQSCSWTAEQGKLTFVCSCSRLRIWSRKTGSAVPSRVNPLIFHTQAESSIINHQSSIINLVLCLLTGSFPFHDGERIGQTTLPGYFFSPSWMCLQNQWLFIVISYYYSIGVGGGLCVFTRSASSATFLDKIK